MQQLRIRVKLPTPCHSVSHSEPAFRQRFHDGIKTTISNIYSKASLFQALRSGLETPIWSLDCRVRLRVPTILRYAKTKFKNALTKCFEEIVPPQELSNIIEAFKTIEFCEDSEPFNDNASWWRDEGQNQGADSDISIASRDSISNMGVPEGGAAATEDQVLAAPSTLTDENGRGGMWWQQGWRRHRRRR